MSREAELAPRDAAVEIARALTQAGHTAYLAGGCVRDELLGLVPKDFDVATSATPDEVKAIWPKARGVGEAFGVMLVRRGGQTIEVATFREDLEYVDGRRPSGIRFADAPADAMRRDFTINGLFRDPSTGEVVDFVGGEADLRARIVRAIGDPHERIREDRLRMLRAVRFTARLGFTLDASTAAAIRAHASELASVSAERVGDEIRRMLDHPARGVATRLIESLGLDGAIFGGAARTHAWRRVEGLGRWFSQTRVQPMEAIAPIALAAWWLDRQDAGACLVRPTSEAISSAAEAIRGRLALSNQESSMFTELLGRREEILSGFDGLAKSARVRLIARRGFDAALSVLEGEAGPDAARILAKADELCLERRLPAPMVGGNDLVAAGLRPGPGFRGVLDATLDRQMEGGFADRAEALGFALSMARRGGSGPNSP